MAAAVAASNADKLVVLNGAQPLARTPYTPWLRSAFPCSYRALFKGATPPSEAKAKAAAILRAVEGIGDDEWQVGKTKVGP